MFRVSNRPAKKNSSSTWLIPRWNWKMWPWISYHGLHSGIQWVVWWTVGGFFRLGRWTFCNSRGFTLGENVSDLLVIYIWGTTLSHIVFGYVGQASCRILGWCLDRFAVNHVFFVYIPDEMRSEFDIISFFLPANDTDMFIHLLDKSWFFSVETLDLQDTHRYPFRNPVAFLDLSLEMRTDDTRCPFAKDVQRQLARRQQCLALPLGTRPSNPQQNAQLGEARIEKLQGLQLVKKTTIWPL